MKIGGEIPWNALPICETFKISCLMGETPHERCFGKSFKEPIVPFGSLVEYHAITAKDQSRIHQFGKKVLPGLFLGYALYAGGIWKGDVLIADLEELETMDASEIYSEKTQCERCNISQRKKKIYFSSRRRTNKNCWRRSGTENTHLDTGTPNSGRRSHRFSRRIRRVFFDFVGRHHVEPRVFSYSTEIYRRCQEQRHIFGCIVGEHHRILLER